MGFMDKVKAKAQEVGNKITDTVVTPKSIFEKECDDYTCFDMDDLLDTEDVKAKIIDEKAHVIQFSGDIALITKAYKNMFFIDKNNRVFTIDMSTVKQKVEEIQQKAQVGEHITTTAVFCRKEIVLKDAD